MMFKVRAMRAPSISHRVGVKESTGYGAELWPIDLGGFDSVRAFLDRFDKEEERLDLLIENASTTLSSFQTEDGWESTFVMAISS
jgi:retinol dehydrogenase 12